MSILVTGAAGFIGFHLSKKLLENGYEMIGLDNLNDYYDISLKEARLNLLQKYPAFTFHRLDIADQHDIAKLFKKTSFETVVHLAAQAGVRYSLENPHAYVEANLVGFGHILEGCRHQQVKHLIFASSSSVYGANTKIPFSESDNVDHPVSLYAATKKANELMAHTYAHLFQLPCTGLRFFTVYGPWGRPDMALFKFTRSIINNEPIEVYNHGEMERDFTYVEDIVESIFRLLSHPAKPNSQWSGDHPDPASSYAPYQLLNIGNNSPVKLMDFIAALENELGKKAIRQYMDLQAGDVPKTYADTSKLIKLVDFKPRTSIETGIKAFVQWYREYYKIS